MNHFAFMNRLVFNIIGSFCSTGIYRNSAPAHKGTEVSTQRAPFSCKQCERQPSIPPLVIAPEQNCEAKGTIFQTSYLWEAIGLETNLKNTRPRSVHALPNGVAYQVRHSSSVQKQIQDCCSEQQRLLTVFISLLLLLLKERHSNFTEENK